MFTQQYIATLSRNHPKLVHLTRWLSELSPRFWTNQYFEDFACVVQLGSVQGSAAWLRAFDRLAPLVRRRLEDARQEIPPELRDIAPAPRGSGSADITPVIVEFENACRAIREAEWPSSNIKGLFALACQLNTGPDGLPSQGGVLDFIAHRLPAMYFTAIRPGERDEQTGKVVHKLFALLEAENDEQHTKERRFNDLRRLYHQVDLVDPDTVPVDEQLFGKQYRDHAFIIRIAAVASNHYRKARPRIVAFAMGTHPRLGEDSPIAKLDPALVRAMASFGV